MKFISLCLSLVSGIIGAGIFLPAYAQVTSDGTTNTNVNTNGNNFTIINGIEKGNNLFHSFSNFSVPTGGSAKFDLVNTPNITTIFSRVTGGNVSNIDGLIQTLNSNNSVDLFLLNPNGIIFGQNAKLDISGSFLGTTANRIKFADGIEFSAVHTSEPPLLTMSVPVGLQMGKNPGAIENQGAILEVKSGNTFALIGGDISKIGGELRLDGGGGRIELAALDDDSQINLNQVTAGWTFDAANTKSFRDIQFTQGTLVNVSGNGSASINVAARNFTLSDNSKFQADNRGSLQGGDITINATSSISVGEISEIRTETIGTGDSAGIALKAPNIKLYNDGDLVSVALEGSGNAGAITLEGQEVNMVTDPDFTKSPGNNGIVTITLDKGNAGDIKINADSILFSPGAITNLAIGEGNAGISTLKAKTINILDGGGTVSTRGSGDGGELNFIAETFYMETDAGFSGSSSGSGNAGNINVSATRSIIIRDEADFVSSTSSSGNAGNINLKSDYIEINNGSLVSRSTGLGDSGNINVSGETIKFLNGGHLNVITRASGNAGDINVRANTVEFNGGSTTDILNDKNTGLISSVLPDAENPNAITGNGGNIYLSASSLVISNGALISASASAGEGNGGNINLEVDSLELLNGGQIMNLTRSAGNAGTITVNAGDNILVSGSDALHQERQLAYGLVQIFTDIEYNIGSSSGIFANTTETASGNGGNLQLTGGNLKIEDGAKITVSSLGSGSAGSFSATLDTMSLDEKASLEAESTAGSNGNLSLDINQALILRRDSKITTNATGSANGGNININSPVIAAFENSDIIANAVEGNGGNINITTQGIFGLEFRQEQTDESDITASSQFGVNGTVDIKNFGTDPGSGLVELPIATTDPSQQIAAGCADTSSSSFIATGRGGIPENPNQNITSDRTWSDIRDISAFRQDNPVTAEIPTPVNPIIQVTSWRRNAQGEVELIAENTSSSASQSLTCAAVPQG